MFQSAPHPLVASRRAMPDYLALTAFILARASLVGYLCQTVLFAPIRYFLVTIKLEPLWYVADALGLMCLAAIIVLDATARNYRVLLFLLILGAYAIEGYFVSSSTTSVLSTFKALVPIFCGLLLNRQLLTGRFMRWLFLLFWVTACLGVVYSMYGNPPWSSLQFEGVGVSQAYKAAQWTSEGEVRNFGFSGDQHGAASSILTLLILLQLSSPKFTFYLFGMISIVITYITTSHTNLIALLIFLGLSLFVDLNKRVDHQFILKWSLRFSFLAILVPAFVIGFAQWYASTDIPKSLLSLWIRGDQTWLAPFGFIEDLAPYAPLFGFGLGGIGFGLLQTDLVAYARTIDNFDLFNLLTFGAPFCFFYLYQCRQMLLERDPHRILVFIVISLIGIPLRGWSDYLFMILYGYATMRTFRGFRYRPLRNSFHSTSIVPIQTGAS